MSVAHIEPKSRTEIPRKTKIGTEVAHVTRDSATNFKVKRSKTNLQGAGAYCGGLPHSLLMINCKKNLQQRNHTSKTAKMKKAPRETQTLRAGCSKAEPKIFAQPQTPFPGTRDGQNLNNWRRSLPSPTNPVWWGSMHEISSYRGNRPGHTHPQTGPITIHRAAANAQCN